MTTDLGTVLSRTTLPVIATIVGGIVPTVRNAAGALFAVVAAKLLPDMKHAHAPATIGLGFAGFLPVYLVA